MYKDRSKAAPPPRSPSPAEVSPTSPRFSVVSRGRVSERALPGLLVLTLAAVAGNYFSLPLFFGVDFLFGSIAVLLAAALFGPLAGAGIALLASIYTLLLWDHPYAMVVLVLEGLLVGLALRRYPHVDLTVLAAGFWLLIGMPLVWLMYVYAIGMNPQASLLVLLKFGVNGVFNALVAVLLLCYTPLSRWILGSAAPASFSFPLRGGLFHLTAALVLLAIMTMAVLEGHTEYRNIERDVAERLQRSTDRSVGALQNWLGERETFLHGLGARAVDLGLTPGVPLSEAARALERADRGLKWVAVVQVDGTVLASGGAARHWNPSGVSQLARGGPPQVVALAGPEDAQGRRLLRLAVPIVEGDRAVGYVVGDFALAGIAAVFAASAAAGGLRVVVHDAGGAPLIDSSLHAGAVPEAHPLVFAGAGVSGVAYWMPKSALSLPPMERWRQTVFVSEGSLAEATALGGSLRVELPAAPYRERLYAGYINTLGAGLLVLLLGLAVAHVVSRRIVGPIRTLAGVTANLPETLHDAQRENWPNSRFAEVRELTRNFQNMVRVLQRQFRELQEVKEALERRAGELAAAQGKLNGILNSVEDVVWSAHIDAEGCMRVDYVSPAMSRSYGYDPQVLVGRPNLWVELAHPEWREELAVAMQDLAAAREDEMDVEYCIRARDGNERHVRNRAWLTRDGSGGAWRVDGIVSDVTEWRAAQDQLRLSAKVFENTAEAIMITGPDHRIVSVNRAFSEITGYAPQELVGERPHRLFAPRHGVAFFAGILDAVRQQGQWRGEAWGRRRSDEEYPQWLSVTAVAGGGRDGGHHIALFSDISERRAREEHIRQLAHYDFLTGLPNRALFQELLGQAMFTAQRRRRELAVLFLDLDRFKNVNDSLGHLVGDDLLREVARRLSVCTRAVDVVSRQGGDEFVVMVSDVESAIAAGQVADKLLQAVAEPYDIRGHALSVTPSIGIAMYPQDGQDMESLMKHADVAMYHAKAEGRNNYQFFAPALNAAAGERLRMEGSLRQAMQRDELLLRYQPQVDTASGRVVGVEALVRWRHPTEGMLLPQRFVPMAEESGIIVPLGAWVLQEACRQAQAWQAAGVEGVSIAVNLSPAQFRHGSLPTLVREALAESGLAPECLELELTENIIMPGDETVGEVLRALKDMGVRLAVDDFGTGYSNLSYLKRFPLDKLKIDGSFVSDMTTDKGDAAIVSAIIGLGKKLNYSVLAEGVETVAQYSQLQAEGCEQIQGYYVCRPVDADQLMVLLSDTRKVH